MTSLNIVELIERSPLTRLNKEYEHRFIEKIRDNFTEEEQHIFLASFYMYLNYDTEKDFVVDFEFVWKWCGFTRKNDAKRVLEKHFLIDADYIVQKAVTPTSVAKKNNENHIEDFALVTSEAKISNVSNIERRGGANKETILLTINAFKKFCLKAGTKKADDIHNYYIKLENLIQQTLDEETRELREQLTKKDEALMDKIEEFNKLQDNHNRILYKRNKHNLMKGRCFYIIKHDDIHHKFKFGVSKDLNSRASAYRTYDINQFLYVIYTEDNKILEDCISRKYKDQLSRHNSEWVCNVDLNDIIHFLDSVIELLGLDTKKYTNMDDIIIQEEVTVTKDDDSIDNNDDNHISEQTQKKCNKCMLVIPKTSFNKDKSKKDGLHSTCRLCEKETKKKYMLKKQETMEHVTEKICKMCNMTKDISQFSKHLYNKDGYVNFCHSCVQSNSNDKRRTDRDNNIRYACGRCGSDYSRRDVLVKHQKNCML